jgi:hypothetical protein
LIENRFLIIIKIFKISKDKKDVLKNKIDFKLIVFDRCFGGSLIL